MEQKMSSTAAEEEACMTALHFASGAVVPMALKAAVELDLFRLIKTAAGGTVSAAELAARLPASDPAAAAAMLERVLRLLAAHSILSCTLHGGERRYALSPVGAFFTVNDDGVSLSPAALMSQDKVLLESWQHLKDAILEGGVPFERAHGVSIYGYAAKDGRIGNILNKAMSQTTFLFKKVFEMYKGFEGIQTLVDVGGGTGATLNIVVSGHPLIKGINFDLPHVIQHAPSYPGIEHVGGDMFVSVPKGDAIFMKWIMPNWGDSECLTILKNCKEAVPENGKVVLVDYVIPEIPTSGMPSYAYVADLQMLVCNRGAKQRTESEFRILAKEAGFKEFRKVCTAFTLWVIELYK